MGQSLSGLINEKGGPRARYILLHMLSEARRNGVQLPQEYTTPYVNTIPVDQEPYFPGDEAWSANTAAGSAGTLPSR